MRQRDARHKATCRAAASSTHSNPTAQLRLGRVERRAISTGYDEWDSGNVGGPPVPSRATVPVADPWCPGRLGAPAVPAPSWVPRTGVSWVTFTSVG